MDVIGIICEYNPFHNGHLYHINKIKEMYPDSIIILALNGYFLERGEVSILSKEDKTKIALINGVDLVLELPVLYGSQSADTFADISIKILNNFKVNKIIFGSESNNIELMKEIAIKQNSKEYNELVKKYLDEGINYPTALAKALNIDFEFTPNDLLGISYLKAILNNNFNIEAISIKRTNDYHDTISNDNIISAENIRNKLSNNMSIDNYIPYNISEYKINMNDSKLFNLLKYKINIDDNLNEYLDVCEGIEYRLKEKINEVNNLDDYINLIKTKRYTYNKIKRMLIHILLSIKKDDATYNLEYIKILGFNKNGKNYLNNIKDNITITTNVNKESKIYNYELNASIIYDLLNDTNTYEFELKNKPIIID